MNKYQNLNSLKVYSFCIKKTTKALAWVGIYATSEKAAKGPFSVPKYKILIFKNLVKKKI
jgi:hypothetical protein